MSQLKNKNDVKWGWVLGHSEKLLGNLLQEVSISFSSPSWAHN